MSPYHHHPPRPGKKSCFLLLCIYETRYCDADVRKVFGSGPHCVITKVVKIGRMSKTVAIHYHAKVMQSKIYQNKRHGSKIFIPLYLGKTLGNISLSIEMVSGYFIALGAQLQVTKNSRGGGAEVLQH